MYHIKEISEFSIEGFEAVRQMAQLLSAEAPPLTEELYREILSAPHIHLFFIFGDAEAIAGMLTLATYCTPTGSKAWIEDVVVLNAYRGKGLGKQLTQHAIAYTRRKNIHLLMLTSSPSRIAANQLYQSAGFQRKETNVYRMQHSTL